MQIVRVLAIAVIGLSLGVMLSTRSGQAQIREQQPAEFPPASYKGKQYVDSRGCVFIRAGIDGDVAWVPRVSRDRKIICGFRPSLAGEVAAAEPAPVKKLPDAAEEITVDAPAAAPAPKAKPAPKRVATVAKPKEKAPVVVRQTAPQPAPVRKVVQQAPAERQVVRGDSPCAGASALSQQYLRGSGVRCGPQSAAVAGNIRAQGAAPAQQRAAGGAKPRLKAVKARKAKAAETIPYAKDITTKTRIVPKHVAENRVNTRNVKVPLGYRPVWDDDRLNPYRAEQNLAGRHDMLLIWTQTVPRRLINQTTGRDVTASVPLIYPYTSLAAQKRALGEVTIVQRDGQLVKRIVRNPVAKRQPTYSSRSAPKPVATPKGLAGKKYVQIGTYRQAENAQRAARSVARMGFPARIGKHRRNGKRFMSVQAGPFASAGDLQAALRHLRKAGYRDAFAR